jgi:hypothetical protein
MISFRDSYPIMYAFIPGACGKMVCSNFVPNN